MIDPLFDLAQNSQAKKGTCESQINVLFSSQTCGILHYPNATDDKDVVQSEGDQSNQFPVVTLTQGVCQYSRNICLHYADVY